MKAFTKKLLAFLKDEEGLTTVEYAIAGSLVAGGVIVAFSTLGTNVDATVDRLADCAGGNTSC